MSPHYSPIAAELGEAAKPLCLQSTPQHVAVPTIERRDPDGNRRVACNGSELIVRYLASSSIRDPCRWCHYNIGHVASLTIHHNSGGANKRKAHRQARP